MAPLTSVLLDGCCLTLDHHQWFMAPLTSGLLDGCCLTLDHGLWPLWLLDCWTDAAGCWMWVSTWWCPPCFSDRWTCDGLCSWDDARCSTCLPCFSDRWTWDGLCLCCTGFSDLLTLPARWATFYVSAVFLWSMDLWRTLPVEWR